MLRQFQKEKEKGQWMNGRNKKFLDHAFFLAPASEAYHTAHGYIGDYYTFFSDLSDINLDSQNTDLGFAERTSGAGIYHLSGLFFRSY